MDKHYFIELLHKYLKGESTEEEKQFLISYYNLFESDTDIEVLSDEEKKREISNTIRENIWKNIEAKEQLHKRQISIKSWFVRVAAAAIFIAIGASVIFFAGRQSPKKQNFVSLVNQQKEIRLIHLPDGSTVIVNTGATLKYPPSFDRLNKREVYLEGEAFFDIARNPDKPFVVHTGKLKTTVLGTAFNVKALPNETNITVTVTRGKVKITDHNKTLGLITKGQEIIYNKRRSNFLQKTVNGDVKLNWKKQDLFFDDVTVEDAAKLLEERFNVTISFEEPEIKTNRFTTVFLKDETIEQVVKSICEFNNAVYEYNKKNATIIISKINPN